MSIRNYDHTHQYSAVSKKLYRCTFPRAKCPHIIAKRLMEGRTANCPLCGYDFVMTKDHLRRKVVTCLICKKSPRKTLELQMQEEADKFDSQLGIFKGLIGDAGLGLNEGFGNGTDENERNASSFEGTKDVFPTDER